MNSGRPRKKRIVHKKPESFKFSPRGKRGKPDSVLLSLEEFEAMRLADCQSKKHSDAADMMNVSRQTFERILKSARRTVSDAIVNGKGIKIWGGSYDYRDVEI
ncbi:MAG: DUF134 domain-containing protein [Candidatus Omnitrophota bacterium]|jgi:predicted DNA-binding protein (UPF0251 family)